MGGMNILISDVILYMQMPIWNGGCAIMPWLVLGASQRWGSRVVQVVVGSHWSGLRESVKSVPVSNRVSPRAASPVVQLGQWSVFKVSGLDHLGSLLPPPPNGGRHGVAGVVGSLGFASSYIA
jgi:hypothetical protein